MAGARPKTQVKKTGSENQYVDPLSNLNLSRFSATLSDLIPKTKIDDGKNFLSYSGKLMETCLRALEPITDLFSVYKNIEKNNDYAGEDRRHDGVNLRECVISGSVAEGLGLWFFPLARELGISDFDLLFPFPINCNEVIVIDSDPDLHPGFARIIPKIQEMYNDDFKDVLPGSDLYYLSSKKVKRIPEDVPFQCRNSGPALKTAFVPLKGLVPNEIDLVVCLSHPAWPDIASEWLERERLCEWPPDELIREVKNGGCHLVPSSHRRSVHPDVEWRYSFSKAEKTLIQSLSGTQKQCFIIFKSLCLYAMGDKGIFKSFFLKNIFLWSCESFHRRSWKQENLADCFFALVDELLRCLHSGELPHYFICTNNLIAHIDKEYLEDLESKIVSLRYNPLEYVEELEQRKKSKDRKKFPAFFRYVSGACEVIDEFNDYVKQL